ncbi:MAG: holo-ACP synthase [Candidatus Melainabacteria bacterium]|nr:holo-ACP synthase [Candidatus Melainabacteria bacterium]
MTFKHKTKVPYIKIGTDICQTDRIRLSYKRFGKRFLKRVLTENEIKYVTSNKKNLISRLAGRFAAKEATSKVLGTGLRGVYFKEIEILRESSGAPKIILHKRAKQKAKEKELHSFEVSISHERDFAVAFVIGIRS